MELTEACAVDGIGFGARQAQVCAVAMFIAVGPDALGKPRIEDETGPPTLNRQLGFAD
jgi:hypothetical protein